MHNPKLLFRWTWDWMSEDRNTFYIGPDQNKIVSHNMDHGCITNLKDHNINVKFNHKINKEEFLKYLIESNAINNKLTYIMDFGFRTYPWYDIDCTEFNDIIDSFSTVKGFDNLKWRFSNTYDVYSTELEKQRLDWFLEITKGIKQENLILDFVNFDTVDLYAKAFPNASVGYRSIYFSRMIYSNLYESETFEPIEKRDKHFLCLNNFKKHHRDVIVDLCAEHEDKTTYSYIQGGKFLDCHPHKTEYRYFNDSVNGTQDRPNYKIMNSAYCYISTETFFDSKAKFKFDNYEEDIALNENVKYAFITEKTLKSAFFKLPMIICGLEGSLKSWKRLGFESFPEFFDESYDNITNAEERMEKVKSEIQKLLKMDINDLHNLYHSDIVQQKLEHNQQTFFKHFRENLKYHTVKYNKGTNLLMDKVMGVTNEHSKK